MGAAASVYVGGRKVVDLWVGSPTCTPAPPNTDSLQLVFSTTKGATAACANLFAERGELDLDAPVAEYWPEFRRTARATSRCAGSCATRPACPTSSHAHLRRSAGLDPMIRALEEQAPSGSRAPPTATTPPPTAGWSERSCGASAARACGTFFHDEFAVPLDLEFWIGLPDEHAGAGRPLIQWGDGTFATPETADPAMKELLAESSAPTACSARRSAHRTTWWHRPTAATTTPPSAPPSPCRQRRHQRPIPRPVLRRAHRHGGGRPVGADPHRRAGRQGLQLQTSGQDKCLFSRRPLGSGSSSRRRLCPTAASGPWAHWCRWLGRLHRPRAWHRVRRRHEQDDGRPQR